MRLRPRSLSAALAGLALAAAALVVPGGDGAAARDPMTFRIATLNVLGDVHTAPYGQADGYAPARIRAEWTSDLLQQLGSPSIVGMQELDAPQLRALLRATGGAYAAYPGAAMSNGVQASLMWRTDTWTATAERTITIPFIRFKRANPVVRLQNNETGRSIWVINVHNAPRDYQAQRDQAVKQEIATIQDLRASGLPVFLLGDMNEKERVFCKVVGQTDLTSPRGGSVSGSRCEPPSGFLRVDWIFGGPDASWSDFVQDQSPLKRWINDHVVPVTTVTLP